MLLFTVRDYIAGPASGQFHGVWCKFSPCEDYPNPASSEAGSLRRCLTASRERGPRQIISPVAQPLSSCRSGRLEETQPPRGCTWRRARRQAQKREDLDYHRRFLDGSDDLQLAAALRAVFKVDIEYPLEQARAAWKSGSPPVR